MKAEDLIKLLERAQETKILDFGSIGQEILNDGNFRVIEQTIPNITGLLALEFAFQPISSAVMEQLAPAIGRCCSLRHLDMNWCGINHAAAKMLFDVLKDHPSLLALELMDNQFVDGEDLENTFEGVLALADLLRTNRQLLNINLAGNKLGLSAGSEILEALKQNNTILSMNFDYRCLFDREDEQEIDAQLRKNQYQFMQTIVVGGKLELAPVIPQKLVEHYRSWPLFDVNEKIKLALNPILFIADLQTEKQKAVLQPMTENEANKRNPLLLSSGQASKKVKSGVSVEPKKEVELFLGQEGDMTKPERVSFS